MRFNNLLYFKTIVEQGQISRAARVLHMSQPPLSQRLKELETEVGATLIERSGGNWAVTSEGTALYRRALRILDLVNTIPEEIQAARLEVKGRVTIGCTTLFLSLPAAFIPRLNQLHPGVSIRLLIEDSTVLERKLREHSIDFCITVAPRAESGLRIVHLLPTSPALVVPPSLATEAMVKAAEAGRPIDIAELDKKPILIFRRFDGGGTYTRTMELFRKCDVAPHVVLDSPDSRSLFSLLEQGLAAMAIAPDSEIPARIREDFLVCALPDAFPKIYPCLARVENRYLPRAALTAWEELQGVAEARGLIQP